MCGVCHHVHMRMCDVHAVCMYTHMVVGGYYYVMCGGVCVCVPRNLLYVNHHLDCSDHLITFSFMSDLKVEYYENNPYNEGT